MSRGRDNQRSKCYAWERAVAEQEGHSIYEPDFKTVDECAAWAAPIWRKERGRVGLAKAAAPSIERPSWGQRSALAHGDHRITLPRWARNRWVILHEMAHRLTPKDEAHGPRFVGVLMGLAARWMDCDADTMMRAADEAGVKYHVRSIGVVPTHGPAWHLERALRHQGPATPMDIACQLSLADGVEVTERQVRGAALVLIRLGKARWLRKRLLLTAPAAQPAAPVKERAPRKSPLQQLRERAGRVEAVIENDGEGQGYWVTSKRFNPDSEDDPLCGGHWCANIGEAARAVQVYEEHAANAAKATT